MTRSAKAQAKKIARNLDNAPHTLLLAALTIARIPRRTRKNHLGGAAPSVSPSALARLALWCAELAREDTSLVNPSMVDTLIADARALLANRALAESRVAELAPVAPPLTYQHGLRRAPTPPEVVIARCAVRAALIAATRPGSIRGPVREAVEKTIRLMRDRADQEGGDREIAMRYFCDELDGWLIRTEAEEVLAERVGITPSFEEVVWRAPPGDRLERAPTFILRLGADSFGLFGKTGSRYEWHVGSRDDILATVPDVWMASAVAALIPGPSGAVCSIAR